MRLMHPYPHLYRASASAAPAGTVTVASPSLPDIATAPPPEFDGPGGVWSPESLLCAAVADCFILTFRSVSRAAHFAWLGLECRVEGTLERVEAQAQFTRYASFAKLIVPKGSDTAKARSLLERAEHSCLISNSLRGTRTLETEVLEEIRE
jgi:organic hydroperoxide reductase OsmC/OhrA